MPGIVLGEKETHTVHNLSPRRTGDKTQLGHEGGHTST